MEKEEKKHGWQKFIDPKTGKITMKYTAPKKSIPSQSESGSDSSISGKEERKSTGLKKFDDTTGKANPFKSSKKKTRSVLKSELGNVSDSSFSSKKEDAKTTEKDISNYFSKISPKVKDLKKEMEAKPAVDKKRDAKLKLKQAKMEERNKEIIKAKAENKFEAMILEDIVDDEEEEVKEGQAKKEKKEPFLFIPKPPTDEETKAKILKITEAELKEKGGASSNMDTSLVDKTHLVEEVLHSEMVVPTMKDPKIKELPRFVNEFVRPAGDIDFHKIRTLMSYMNQDDLIELFGKKYIDTYVALKSAYVKRVEELKLTNPEVKVSAGKFKKLLLDLPSVLKAFSANGTIVDRTWKRHVEKVKAQNEKTKANAETIKAKRAASKLTSKPKRKFMGALLSKVTPEQYRDAMIDFNDEANANNKNLHKYANVTPGKMIKELERQAYAEKKKGDVASVLADPDSYKADGLGAGVKKRIKDIEERLKDKTQKEKEQDEEYKNFVMPHLKYKSDESVLIGEIRTAIARGKKPADIKAKLAA